jgi:PKD repeat protein
MCLLFISLNSCEYDEIANAPYPDSLIYLPAAVEGSVARGGIYTVNEGASTKWVSPTPGQPLKYAVNKTNNEFIVPLSVYRSGFEAGISGNISVNIAVNTDTVANLNASGRLLSALSEAGYTNPKVEFLSVDKLKIPGSVQIEKGKNNASFQLILDLNFLKTNAPAKKLYILAITISSADGEVNPLLNTAIIAIDPIVTVPVAEFSSQLSGSSSNEISFDNTSRFWDFFSNEEVFSWNFGDATAIVHDIHPVHTYAAPGEYAVILEMKGIAGDTASATKNIKIE